MRREFLCGRAFATSAPVVAALVVAAWVTACGAADGTAGEIERADLQIQVHVRGDWVEGTYDVGWPVLIHVTDSSGSLKALAGLETGYPPWFWGQAGFSTRTGDPWVPERPDITVGDRVYVWIDPPSTPVQVQVGDIQGVVDLAADTVSGTVTAPWLTGPLEGWCGIVADTGAPDVPFQVDPNGGSYSCDFGVLGFDVGPADQVLVGYRQPDQHEVMNQFLDPGPYLGIEKRGLSAPTTGGNFEYAVAYWNIGETASESTVITDGLPPGVSYLASTLGIEPVVVGQTVVFDLGAVDPATLVRFSLFVAVSAPVSTSLQNDILIDAPAAIGMGTDWVTSVQQNDTDLVVLSTPTDPQPLPDTDLVWDIEVCNDGGTSSAAVELTDTVPLVTPIVTWWADQAGWEEIAVTSGQVVVERPTEPGGSCLGLHLLTHVSAGAVPGQQLCNLVEVDSGNDLNPDNNVHQACVTVGGGAPAIAIEKSTNGWDADDPPGPAIPVGEAVEWVYEVTNTGNVPLGGVVVEDDQPGVVPDCPSDVIAPLEVVSCSANGLAVDGQYANLGTVTATPQGGGDPVSASDPSHYFGGPADLIFEDGFESGDTAAWSATVP